MTPLESWSFFLVVVIGCLGFGYALSHAAREADRMMERRRRDKDFRERWTQGPHRRVR